MYAFGPVSSMIRMLSFNIVAVRKLLAAVFLCLFTAEALVSPHTTTPDRNEYGIWQEIEFVLANTLSCKKSSGTRSQSLSP